MPPKLKRSRSSSLAAQAVSSDPSSSQRAKKLKLLASHTIDSPFHDFIHPTPSEASQVHALLAKEHPSVASERKAPSDANDSAGTCGSVPNVLESLVGTILSQNTSSQNSTAAKHSLDSTFGRNNFAAIARAPRADVVEAIKMGGLANKKAGVIQNILNEVYERHGAYSLQHLAGVVESESTGKKAGSVSDEEAMKELVSYDGVGPKTASCSVGYQQRRTESPLRRIWTSRYPTISNMGYTFSWWGTVGGVRDAGVQMAERVAAVMSRDACSRDADARCTLENSISSGASHNTCQLDRKFALVGPGRGCYHFGNSTVFFPSFVAADSEEMMITGTIQHSKVGLTQGATWTDDYPSLAQSPPATGIQLNPLLKHHRYRCGTGDCPYSSDMRP